MIQTFRRGSHFYFRVRAEGNNRIVAQSEGYTTPRARDKGIAALIKAATSGKIEKAPR